MNNKILISFLALAVIVVAIYLTISTFYEKSMENSYGIKGLTPPVSFNNIRSSRPKIQNSSAYQMQNINTQAPLSSTAFHSQTSTNGVGLVAKGMGSNNRSYQSVAGNLQPGVSTSSDIGVIGKPIRRASEGSFSGNLLPGVAGKTSNKTSTASSSGLMAYNGNKSTSPSSYVPFSEGGSSGTPDPGGNADDSCDDDIVFIPVPDGLNFLIFLSLSYALLILVRIKKNKQRLSVKT